MKILTTNQRACRLALLAAIITPLFYSCTAEPQLPPGIVITSESTTHVHAVISDLRVEDYPTLARIHALFTVYYKGQETTDEKLKALAQLRFTNLACVVLTDCRLITDRGIEDLSQIPTLTRLGLRQMAITDAACDTMVRKMRLSRVNMPNCMNVTSAGLLKMAQSETLESLGFSVGQMTQDEVLRIIRTAGPKMNRMDIEMAPSSEARLDLSVLRQAGERKGIMLYAVRNQQVRKL
ncbi:MAG TPA: hypothetical protein P5186_13535 [Candidatus Paceibacterota bacterium]|nr:hypothetical protein [Candidatus Paceibacterota bacterium]